VIRVHILLFRNQIKTLHVSGHAKMSKGMSVPCATVSLMVHAISKSLAQEKIAAHGVADAPGEFFLDVQAPAGEYLRGLTSMFLAGMSKIKQEYPKELLLDILED